jgi:type II secretory pathway component PulM
MDETTDSIVLRHGMAILAALLSLAFFCGIYLPGKCETRTLEQELAVSRQRVSFMRTRIRRLEERCEELAAADPEALADAIREVLGKDQVGGFVLAPEDKR